MFTQYAQMLMHTQLTAALEKEQVDKTLISNSHFPQSINTKETV